MTMRQARWALAVLVVALASLLYVSFPRTDAPRDEAARLAGRVLMVGFEGRGMNDAGVRRTLAQIAEGRLAGVMYLRRNVRGGAQVTALNRAFREASAIPPLVALDQEGGRVARLGWRSRFPRTPAALTVAASRTPLEARTLYARMAQELKVWGFNVNFGPVVDLHRGDNPIIGRFGRAFAAEPEAVTRYARAFQDAHRAANVATALKHFPGHGSSTADTHLAAADVTATWSERELEPYRALLATAPMVMTGHVSHAAWDGGTPATLSRAVVAGLLRERLGYRGVVVSDDLQMDAIAVSEERAAVAAIGAGVDLLLFANDGRVDEDLVPRVTAALARAARRDVRFRARLREAGDRVERLRARLEGKAMLPRMPAMRER